MSEKNFDLYTERLSPERSSFHIIEGGNLYLINFDVNQTALKQQHIVVIDNKVVPFLCSAIRKLGPGDYNLNVVGSASATGPTEHNADLAAGRAYNAAMYAIRKFEEKQKTDASLAGATINPNTQAVGDELSIKEAKLLNLRQGHVEKQQNHFRAAMFRFAAGLHHPGKGAVFYIREVYKFKFDVIREPLPVALEKLKKLISIPGAQIVIDEIYRKALGKAFDICDDLLPLLGPAAGYMVSVMIPRDVDYCFDIRDYRQTTARYRFHGIEHRASLGILDLLGYLSRARGVVTTIFDVIKKLNKGFKYIQEAEKALKEYNEAIKRVEPFLRKTAGDPIADAFKKVLDVANAADAKWDELTIPASEWFPFMFHDRSPKHSVMKCDGPARRTSTDIGYKSAVDLDFAGPVPNNWRDYNAEAKIISPFRWSNSFWGQGQSHGQLLMVTSGR